MKKVLGFVMTLMIGLVITLVLAGMTVVSKVFAFGRQQVSNSYDRGALCVKALKRETSNYATLMWHQIGTWIGMIQNQMSTTAEVVNNSIQEKQAQVKKQVTPFTKQFKLEIKEMFKMKHAVAMLFCLILGFTLSKLTLQPQTQSVGSASTNLPVLIESSSSFDVEGLEQALEDLNATVEIEEEITMEETEVIENESNEVKEVNEVETEEVKTEEVVVSKPVTKPTVSTPSTSTSTTSKPSQSKPSQDVSKPSQSQSKPSQEASKPSQEETIKEEVSIDHLPEVQEPVETPSVPEEIVTTPSEPILLEGEEVVGDFIINESLLGDILPEGAVIDPY